jgi:hypothetical protein
MAKTKRSDSEPVHFERGLRNIRPPWEDKEVFLAGAGGIGPEDRWAMEVEFLVLDGRPYVFAVRVLPHGIVEMASTSELPPGGVTARVLRGIKLGEVLDSFRLAERLFPLEGKDRPYRAAPVVKRGRTPYDDEHYRRVAWLYLRAIQEEPRRPVRRMAKRLNYSDDRVRQWVRQARMKGFLTEASPGRPGAFPGPRLGGNVIDWEGLFSPTEQ